MNLALTILSILAAIGFAINRVIKYKRFKHSIGLKRTYNKMEMYFTVNSIPVTNDYIQFLKTFKTLSVNPDYLDIQILAISKIATQKSGVLQKDTKKFDSTLHSLGDGFMELFKEFDNSAHSLVKLSFFKPDFMLFLFKMLVKYAFHSGVLTSKRIFKELTFIQDNDEAIFYSAGKLSA